MKLLPLVYLTTLTILAGLIIAFLVIFVLDIIKRRKSETKYHLRESILAFVLLLPAVILAFFFVILPIFFSLSYSFTDFNLNTEPVLINFTGFENFKDIINDFQTKGEVYKSFRNTAIFVVLVVPIQIGLALFLALFCNNKRRGTTIFKICFFAPVAVSLSVTAYLWYIILSPTADGTMNTLLGFFGIEAQDFLGNKDTVLIWMVIISAWQGCGYQMLIFLSALGNIRKDLYEAASIDGANAFRRFFTVTLPGLKPTLLYILITVFIGACRVLIQPMFLTGYVDSSMTLSYYMYVQGLDYGLIGLSCSVALMLTIIIGSITLVQRKLLGEKNNG
ncbi:MAG: sugar ABC transporter permease [Bacilli bacterium]|nr:sugar ABC transporter permease [Bacilli bacterium]